MNEQNDPMSSLPTRNQLAHYIRKKYRTYRVNWTQTSCDSRNSVIQVRLDFGWGLCLGTTHPLGIDLEKTFETLSRGASL